MGLWASPGGGSSYTHKRSYSTANKAPKTNHLLKKGTTTGAQHFRSLITQHPVSPFSLSVKPHFGGKSNVPSLKAILPVFLAKRGHQVPHL